MKFIYSIIIIILVLISVVVVSQLALVPSADNNAALVINNSVVTFKEFNRLASFLKPVDKKDFTNSLILKELLVQEAMKLGIDKDEAFRLSVQNFYEQSLIKLLTEKKLGSLKITVSDADLDRYIAFQRKKLQLTVFTAADEKAAQNMQFKSQKTIQVRYDDLAEDVRVYLLILKTGEMTKPVQEGDGYAVFRLDRIEETGQSVPVSGQERERIRKRLEEHYRQKAMDVWIASLKNKAVIKNNVK